MIVMPRLVQVDIGYLNLREEARAKAEAEREVMYIVCSLMICIRFLVACLCLEPHRAMVMPGI